MNLTEIAVALIGLISVSIGVGFVYKRGAAQDNDANERAAIDQVYTGYGGLLQRVQDDNTELRREVAELRSLRGEVIELRQKVIELERIIAMLPKKG